jgi:hypothetical protein
MAKVQYHKDYRLFEAIESVEAYHKADAGEAQQWLFALAPMIAAVRDFTDGDETGALVADLAGAILIVCPELFPAYYEYLLNNEDWRNAEASIEFFIKQADLNDPINQAIACTVVDSDDLTALRDRAMSGDAGALAAFEVQERFLAVSGFKSGTRQVDRWWNHGSHRFPRLQKTIRRKNSKEVISI